MTDPASAADKDDAAAAPMEVDNAKPAAESSSTGDKPDAAAAAATIADEEKKDEKKDEKPAASPEEVLEAVKERLSFFFSDANLRQDMFLRRLLLESPKDDNDEKKDEKMADDKADDKQDEAKNDNDSGPVVPIESLLRFNTIKQHTTDPAVVVQAAKALPEKLVLSADETAIGRVKPFTRDMLDGNLPLSLLVRNLPLRRQEFTPRPRRHDEKEAKNGKDGDDGDKDRKKKPLTRTYYDVTMGDVKALFEPFGKVALVKMRFRRSYSNPGDDPDDDLVPSQRENMGKGRKIPDGSCLVEFETREALLKAAASLCVATKDEDEKDEKEPEGGSAAKQEEEKKKPLQELQLKDRTLKIVELDKYLAMAKTKKKRTHEEMERGDAKTKEEEKDDVAPDPNAPKPFTIDWKPGCVIRLQGLSADDCDRESLLEAVATGLSITVDQVKQERKVYTDYSRGQTVGAIRFPEPADDIQTLCDKLQSGDVQIKNAKVESAKVLQGEEETKYWKDYIEFKNQQIQKNYQERSANKGKNKNKRQKRGHYRR